MPSRALPHVKVLTVMLLAMTGCTHLQPKFHVLPTCSSRAFTASSVIDQLQSRGADEAPARLAVVPYSVPANLAGANNELPGVGNDLAWKLHAELLASGEIPVAEVFNRQDWPGKKEEFFTGNFGAIQLAEAAGYDAVLVGYLEPLQSLETMSASTKIIDVRSGVTLWYGRTTVGIEEHREPGWFDFLFRSDARPDRLYSAALVPELARCIVKGALVR